MKVLVWDLPLRIVHWLIALAFFFAWMTADAKPYRELHVFFGCLLFGLLFFRLVWGFLGSRYARFSSFLFDPKQALRQFNKIRQGTAHRFIGHNLSAGLAVYLLLGIGMMVCLSGAILHYIDGTTDSILIRELHEIWAIVMLVLVVLHIIGVFSESYRYREDLTLAMLTGYKSGKPEEAIISSHPWAGMLVLLTVVTFGGWYFQGTSAGLHKVKSTPIDPLWQQRCGKCHLAYPPDLLPLRSWKVLLQQPEEHFGMSLILDDDTTDRLMDYVRRYAADIELTETASKIKKSVPMDSLPLRITSTPYWRRKHQRIKDTVWNRTMIGAPGNCAACHTDAEQGLFDDKAIRVPK